MPKITHVAFITANLELEEAERFTFKGPYSSWTLRAFRLRVDENGLSEITAARVLKDGSLGEQTVDVRYWRHDTLALLPDSAVAAVKAASELIKAQLGYVAAGFEVIEP
jgi:hypothetical protein